MNARQSDRAKCLLLGWCLLLAGCAALPPRVVKHYQGHWEVGESYEGFTSLDGKLVCAVDMPASYDRYFLRPGTPTYHQPDTAFFTAAYVEVDGYVTSARGPDSQAERRTLHVVRVNRIAPATAEYLKERTTQRH